MKKMIMLFAVLLFLLQAGITSAALPVTNGLKLWLDSTTYDSEPNTLYTDASCSAGNEASGDGTEVLCWADKSGNGHNVSVPASRGNPQIISSSSDFNDHTVLSFSKTDKDELRYELASNEIWSGSYTEFIIFRQVGTPDNNDSFFSNTHGGGSANDNANHFQITYSTTGNDGNGFYWRGADANGDDTEVFFEEADNDLKLYSVTNEGGVNGNNKITTYVDGVEASSTTPANVSGAEFDVYKVNSHRGYSAFQNSEIAEIIIFDRILSDSEMQQMNDYLGVKYGKQFGPAPGGEGEEISLWLKADAGISDTDGADVTTWEDQSVKGYDAINSGSASQTSPTYHTNSSLINFNPTVEFDGATDGLDLGDNYIFADGTKTDGLSVFAVAAPTAPQNGTHPRFVLDFGYYGDAGYGVSYASDKAIHYTTYDSNIGNAGDVTHNNGNTPAVVDFIVDLGTDQNLAINGNILSTTNTINTLDASNINENPTHGSNMGPVSIGSQSKDNYISNRRFTGFIPEVVVYTKDQKPNRQKIESYLALKYGITLDQSTATDYLASDGTTKMWDSSDTTFNHDIFGIGRDDDSTLDQRVSKSVNPDALVTIATDNDFTSPNGGSRTQVDNLEFLTIANNDSDISAWTQTGAPAGRQILGRAWKVQEVGETDTIYLAVPDDSSSEVTKLPAEVDNKVYLYVDTDTDFSSGATEYPLTLNGDRWELPAGINFGDGQYFTFGTNQPTIIAPGGVTQSIALWLKADGNVTTDANNTVTT